MRIRVQSSLHGDVLSKKRRRYHRGQYVKRLGAGSPGFTAAENFFHQSDATSRKHASIKPMKSQGLARNLSGSSCCFKSGATTHSDSESSEGSPNLDSDSKSSDDEEEEDLPTTERPYSKILSFRYRTRAPSQNRAGRWSRISTEVRHSALRTSCCQHHHEMLHSHKKSHSRPFAHQSDAKLTTRTGSKNLAFLKQQLADQVLRDGRISQIVNIFSYQEVLARNRHASSLVQQSGRQRQQCSEANDCHEVRVAPSEFKYIADSAPVPKSLNDFDMTFFRDLKDEPYAVEWEFVQELIQSSGIEEELTRVEPKSLELVATTEKALQQALQNLELDHQNSVIDNLVKDHFQRLLSSELTHHSVKDDC